MTMNRYCVLISEHGCAFLVNVFKGLVTPTMKHRFMP